MKFFIYLRIWLQLYAKRQKIQSSIMFYRILHKIANILIYKTLQNDHIKL